MKKILINLKDWLGKVENTNFAKEIYGLDVTVYPSLPYLYLYKDCNVKLGSQKISSFEAGPHTGSISASHLKEFGVSSVILNHRECQIDDVNKICAKVQNALKADIDVVICMNTCGKEEIEKIKNVLDNTGSDNITIAYEPSENIPMEEIKINLHTIKENFKNYKLTYLYGNNVTLDNITDYIEKLEIDGFLISSHALNTDDLKKIVMLAKM